MQFEISGIVVSFIGIDDATEQEAKNYIEFVKENIFMLAQDKITSIIVSANGYDISNGCDMVDVSYQIQGPKFERIRRITGYLSGSLETWNDSKRAEERDRVKHAAFN